MGRMDEPNEFLSECRFCLCNSISFVCDSCNSALRKHQLMPIKNEGEYEWFLWNINPSTQLKIRKEICNNA